MNITYAKVKTTGKLEPKSGVAIAGATAVMIVPTVPPHLPEPAHAYLLVAGDVGPMGQALDSGMRWIRSPELDVCGEGGWFVLTGVVAFRLAHMEAELTYSIRKG